MTTICRKCGAELPGGTLLAHELAEHPKAAEAVAKPARKCYRVRCLEVYPTGHYPEEGPHAY